jgi:repressor LexA
VSGAYLFFPIYRTLVPRYINTKQMFWMEGIGMRKDKQEEILKYLCSYPHHYAPTVREICAAVGLKSSASVHIYLTRLEAAGLIERKSNSRRCINVLESRYN